MFSIDEFSKMAKTIVKKLRHYDKIQTILNGGIGITILDQPKNKSTN